MSLANGRNACRRIASNRCVAYFVQMLQFFLNPWMLLGLAGVSLPIIAHLLSRRRHDVIEWAAMQFLNPSRRTRRRLRLEELLLLLIRIGMIVLTALAASRPWINSGFLTGYTSGGSRDVVMVIDGSNSMARSDGLTTLHQKAVRRAKGFLDTLRPGDTVAIIDARDQPHAVVESPLQDLQVCRDVLDTLPPPAGATGLRSACERAVGILGRCSSGAREIVVFTDRQRAGWSVDEDQAWKRFDDVLRFPSVQPRIWVMDVAAGLGAVRRNLAVGRIELSRQLTVPGFPVRFRVPVRNTGATSAQVMLNLLVDGQGVAGRQRSVSVPANSETVVEMEHRFSSVGTRMLTVQLDVSEDAIAADNEAHAAIRVSSAIPVLLVESSPSLNPSRQKTFFAKSALTAMENQSPWVRARVVRSTDITVEDVDRASVVIAPDVSQLPTVVTERLQEFVSAGGGLLIAMGKDTTVENFDKLYRVSGLAAGISLNRLREADPDAPEPVRILPYSLQAGWLDRFREREDSSLLKATFERWWVVEFAERATVSGKQPDADGSSDAPLAASAPAQPPITLAQLRTGEPLLLQSVCGDGTVLLLTTTLNNDWTTLPNRPDYVSFLHEAVFQLASSKTHRNVDFGTPLTSMLPPDLTDNAHFVGPFNTTHDAELAEMGHTTSVSLHNTRLPGVYHLVDRETAKRYDSFVLNYDHGEDVPDELSVDDRARLSDKDRMVFVDSLDALRERMYGNESRSELWALLLWSFLALLVLELWMTRRVVRGGHSDVIRAAGV